MTRDEIKSNFQSLNSNIVLLLLNQLKSIVVEYKLYIYECCTNSKAIIRSLIVLENKNNL